MNYAYLAEKYVPGARFIVHDRTYDGLEWHGPEDKPAKEVFESWDALEIRLDHMAAAKEREKIARLEEAKHIAAVKAQREARSLEEKISEQHEEIRANCLIVAQEAKELQERIKSRNACLASWEEISRAQELINNEARTYLNQTDWYVTRKQETGLEIPEEVMNAREAARARIKHGEGVHSRWQELRSQELPSRKEIEDAIIAGGTALLEIKKICQDVHLRYKRPRAKEEWRAQENWKDEIRNRKNNQKY